MTARRSARARGAATQAPSSSAPGRPPSIAAGRLDRHPARARWHQRRPGPPGPGADGAKRCQPPEVGAGS
eukprot:1270694-Lingulodinium_polyedra.AAC.1